MKNTLKYLLLTGVLAVMALTINAQKFGYMNTAALLQEMPDVQQANANLEVLQKQLQKKGENMLTEFQTKATDLERRYNQGELSPVQVETERAKIQEEEQKIIQYEQDMQQQLAKKQEELLQPIMDKVKNAIQDVAKENSFVYIFDTSTGVVLYADESTDVTAMVKAKLGM